MAKYTKYVKQTFIALLAASEIHCLRKPQVKPLLNLYGCSWQLVHDERCKCLRNILLCILSFVLKKIV